MPERLIRVAGWDPWMVEENVVDTLQKSPGGLQHLLALEGLEGLEGQDHEVRDQEGKLYRSGLEEARC